MKINPTFKERIEKLTQHLTNIRETFSEEYIADIKAGKSINVKLSDGAKDDAVHVAFGFHKKSITLGMVDVEQRQKLEEYLQDLPDTYFNLLQTTILEAIQKGTTLYEIDDEDLACGLGILRRIPKHTPQFTFIVEIQYELGVSSMPFEKYARALASAFLFAQIELNTIIK